MMRRTVVQAVLLVCVCIIIGAAQAQNVQHNDANIQYVGRFANETTLNAKAFSWTGTTITAKVTATTKVFAYLRHTGTAAIYFKVFVDGAYYSNFSTPTTASPVAYPLVSGLTTGSHVISIIRMSEGTYGITYFTGFGLDTGGSLQAPPARPSRRIEFIGDSITTGYGNLGVNGCTQSPLLQDVTVSHGPVAADLLDAEYMISAWSGLGVLHNYADTNNVSSSPFPSYYEYAVPNNKSLGTWSFSSWVPNVIVFNLGTYDFASGGTPPSPAAYQQAYADFVARVKTLYAPKFPQIFIACGTTTNTYCSYAQAVATTVGATFINMYSLNNGPKGCDGHPDKFTHATMAAMESSMIANVMGWGSTTSPNWYSFTNETAGVITDKFNLQWTIMGGVIYYNGTAWTGTGKVIILAYIDGLIWQQNAAPWLNWYSVLGPGPGVTWTAHNHDSPYAATSTAAPTTTKAPTTTTTTTTTTKAPTTTKAATTTMAPTTTEAPAPASSSSESSSEATEAPATDAPTITTTKKAATTKTPTTTIKGPTTPEPTIPILTSSDDATPAPSNQVEDKSSGVPVTTIAVAVVVSVVGAAVLAGAIAFVVIKRRNSSADWI